MNKRIFTVIIVAASLALMVGAPAPSVGATDTGTISGRVMRDLDQDGDPEDTSEQGLPGWTVTLEGPYGGESEIGETTTDADGRYAFEHLPAGEYDVSLPCDGQPSLWEATLTETTGYSATLEAGGELDDLDFPVVPIAAPPLHTHNGRITGRVVLDTDRDGVVADTDPGMSGWHLTVESTGLGGACFTEEVKDIDVDAEGRFTADHLPAGSYSVYLNWDDAPLKRWAVVSPLIAHEAAETVWFQVPDLEVPEGGIARTTIGVASLEGTASISGSIYADLNRNGARDPDEPVAVTGCWMFLAYRFGDGYVGVAPELTNCEPDGVYEFAGLAPGDYMVSALYQFSPAVNPPAGPDTASYLKVSLSEGEQRTGVDFGFEAVPASEEPTPESPQPTPEASLTPATPVAGTPAPLTGVVAPSTGSGGPSSATNAPLFVVATIAITATIGAVGLMLGMRRRARRR